MKSYHILLFTLVLCVSCKQDKQDIPEKIVTTAEKIAQAHGFDIWSTVKSFEFTFGGKMEEPNSGRSWTWNPKTNDITLVRNTEVFSYNRNDMDSVAINADRAFINDKFWALIPFQLVWDEGTTISEPENAISPIKQEESYKIILTYSNEGGYTPGDAYDLYYDKDFIIREWSFRRGNAPEPTLSNTFENYQDFNGIKIALEHKRNDENYNLLIRNVKVVLED